MSLWPLLVLPAFPRGDPSPYFMCLTSSLKNISTSSEFRGGRGLTDDPWRQEREPQRQLEEGKEDAAAADADAAEQSNIRSAPLQEQKQTEKRKEWTDGSTTRQRWRLLCTHQALVVNNPLRVRGGLQKHLTAFSLTNNWVQLKLLHDGFVESCDHPPSQSQEGQHVSLPIFKVHD